MILPFMSSEGIFTDRTVDSETFSVGEFKDLFGLTRKLAIPILEWLDSERITVRQGNQRKIIRRG